MQNREFWKDFVEIPEISIDTAVIARAWKSARDSVITALRAKQAAPLDPIALSDGTLDAVASYDELRTAVAAASDMLQAVNV
jgi:hypothetical protein